ncbi:MAG: hypothetical protein WBD28_04380 [Candidatus Zixiibacteriota bacterium]
MPKPEKLKSSNWGMIVFVLILVIILIGSELFFGKGAFRTVLGILVSIAALVHLVVLFRTKNTGHLVLMLFYVFIVLTFLTRYQPLVLFFAICALILFMLTIYVLSTNRIKWRYTEVLELAARPVNDSNDGFTPRPFPAGDAKYTREEITGFAKFLLKHVIAVPYYEDDRVFLVVPENMFSHLLFLRRDYRKATYVSFDFEGKVTINIAKKDYQKYKQELTFDRLCNSLANLFREFLELYQQGKSKRIIERLNALKIDS